MQPNISPPSTPSVDEITALFRRIHRDGLAAHAAELEALAAAASRLGADRPLVGLLTDTAAPDEIRIRAVARLVNEWPSLTVGDPWFTRTLEALLARWNAHQDLRAAGAGVAELAASRSEVDRARRAHLATRRPLRPTG